MFEGVDHKLRQLYILQSMELDTEKSTIHRRKNWDLALANLKSIITKQFHVSGHLIYLYQLRRYKKVKVIFFLLLANKMFYALSI